MIAETKEDIERYMNLVNSCDVTMDNEGNIILWYTENSNTMKNGCSADFVTKKEGQISLEFGIQGNLTECINMQSLSADNMLSFAYSLKNYELNEIKNGPKGNISDCNDKTECFCNEPNCLKTTPFYAIGWFLTNEGFRFILIGVGDNKVNFNNLKRNQDKKISSTLILKGDMFIQPNITTLLYKKHQELKEWEIKDKDYNYNNKNFTSLFTFHIMPINSMRKSIQKRVSLCSSFDIREICSNETTMLKCDKMFIKFDKEHFKLLVPDTIPINDESTTFTSKIESNSIETSEFSFSTIVRKQTRIKRTRKPKTTKVPETEETGISLIAIILIIVGILIFFSSIISIIIWLFVFRGNNKEEEKEQLPQINSTQPTNTNSETTNVNDNPSFSLNEAKDDSPANVVQTQMDFENSKIIGGVEVPETKVETEEDEVKEEEDNI